jgi:hypothetical protein
MYLLAIPDELTASHEPLEQHIDARKYQVDASVRPSANTRGGMVELSEHEFYGGSRIAA